MMNDDFQDELISAYLDDELSPEERWRVEQRLANDDAARRMVDELRSLRDELRSLPRHKLASDFAQRVLRSAEREMLTGRPRGERDLTVRRRDHNERRRLNIRGLLWAGVAIACAVIMGIEFNSRDRDVAVVDPNESAPEGGTPEAVDKIASQVGEDYKPPSANHTPDRLAGSAPLPDQDAASAPQAAGFRKAESKAPAFAGSSDKTRDKAEGAGDSDFGGSLDGEAQRDRAAPTRSGLRRRQLAGVERQDALGHAKPSDSLLSGGPVYLVTVDLTPDPASRQAWFATLKQHQLFDEDDEVDEQPAFADDGRLALKGQVYSVSLPQSRADALIAALQKRRDSFDVTVHSPSLPDFDKNSRHRKELEEKVRPLRRSASPPAEPAKSKLKLDEAQPAKPKIEPKTDRPTVDDAKRADDDGKRSARQGGKNASPQDEAKTPASAADTPANRPSAAVRRPADDPSPSRRKDKMRRWASADGKAASGRVIDPSLAKRNKAVRRKKAGNIAGISPEAGIAPKKVLPRRSQAKQPEPRVMLFFVLRTTKPETARKVEAAAVKPDTD